MQTRRADSRSSARPYPNDGIDGPASLGRGLGHQQGHRLVRASIALAGALVAVVSGCGSTKNHDDRNAVALYEESLLTPDERRARNIACAVNPNTCTPDPAPLVPNPNDPTGDPIPAPATPFDCAKAVEGLEFVPIWSFDTEKGAPQEPEKKFIDLPGGYTREVRSNERYAYAETLYNYDDETTVGRRPRENYEPETYPVMRCAQPTHALHLWGGPYLAWGGGVGTRMDRLWERECLGADPANLPAICPPADTHWYEVIYDANNGSFRSPRWLNLSDWDGISFWARRGPDGQPGLRVVLGDTLTDEDISYAQAYEDPAAPRACELNVACDCGNQRPCTRFIGNSELGLDDITSDVIHRTFDLDPVTGQGTPQKEHSVMPIEDRQFYYCYDPERDPAPNAHYEGKYLAVQENGFDVQRYYACGQTACNTMWEAFQSKNTESFGKACTDYTFRTGLKRSFCFDPGVDPEPVNSDQHCGDHWIKSINLTTDWQFYKIPFTQLLQQGWAKEFHEIRLDEVSIIRFTWSRGYIDFWLDDVAFYREQRL